MLLCGASELLEGTVDQYPQIINLDYSKNGARIAKPTATAAAPRMIESAILISISIGYSPVKD
jgi:hypothetical protein